MISSGTPLWTGIAVALVTLFDEDDTVAMDATAAHAARLVACGVRAVLVNGTTGEAATLTDEERVGLIKAVRAACPDVPIIAGASGEWWRAAAHRASCAVDAGADALLVAPPRATVDLTRYYAATAVGVPVLAYHFPGVVGGAVPLEAMADLPVQGVKDSSGDPQRLLSEIGGYAGWTYTGSAVLVGYTAALGGCGAILAAANVAPEDCVAAWDGDAAAQLRLLAAHRVVRERYPRGLKAEMALRYGTPARARLA